MLLQAHYIYTLVNLTRATEAQQTWLIQLKWGFSRLSFDIIVLLFAKKQILLDEAKFSFSFQRGQAGFLVVKLGKTETSCWWLIGKFNEFYQRTVDKTQ